MTSKIRVLNDHTINKIAAGEVIENPASVVKELVENSLDAGATDICVEIQAGGRQLIRISDNGCGMPADDALLCLERHATSKMRDVEDIHSLTTMGFRGEAIPSIASISKFTILTCPGMAEDGRAEPVGTMVIVDGGKIISCTPAARSQGTTMEVKTLFFNVPVRKKFLKSPAIDGNEILKTVSMMALGYPSVKFQLLSDGKKLLLTAAEQKNDFSSRLKGRIGDVLGQDFLQNTVYFESRNDTCLVQGVVGLPSYTRHNRTGQYLFINQRAVVSPLLAFAVKDGYGTSLAAGRHPVFVLHLTLNGDLVDVNVHPQKREVRLRQEQSIRELLIKGVQGTLRHTNISINARADGVSAELPTISPVFANSHAYVLPTSGNDDAWIFRPKPQSLLPPAPAPAWLANAPPAPQPFSPSASPMSAHPAILEAPCLPLPERQLLPPKVLATISRFILLDSLSQNEFIARGCPLAVKGGLVLINQKAAHARIIFEKLLQQDADSTITQQSLLIPYPIEVSPFDAEILRGSLALLNRMGMHIQEFGPSSFIIDAIPQIFGHSNLEMLISDIIHDLREMGDQNLQHGKAKQIAMAAARAAIAYERRLSIEEAQGLLDQLVKCREPYRCPLGKSTIVQVTSDELAKLFLR